MHVHSKYSWGCDMNVEKIVEVAEKCGVDGISIIEHDNIDGLELKNEIIKKYGLLAIPGVEINRNQADFLVYFVEDKSILKIKNVTDLIETVHSLDGIVGLAHPYRSGYKLPDKDILRKLDAIEAFNSKCSLGENRRAQKLANDLNITALGGSDAHEYAFIGLGITIVESKDVKKEILNNKVSVEGNYPSQKQKLCSKVKTLKYISPERGLHYFTHPLETLKKLFR